MPHTPERRKRQGEHSSSRSKSSPPPTSRWAVETRGLTKHFGKSTAVDGVDLRVPRGSAFGYLGPNGAGKTTLIRVLLGLTHADEGTMSLLGYPVPQHRDKALVRVGAIVDEPRFHGHLPAVENLQILAAAREPAARGRIDCVARARGHELTERTTRSRSTRWACASDLGVACCLLGDPQLLILDEPMNGLDPAGMQEMRELIRSFVAEGRTVMLSSHLLDEVERTCDAVAIVDHGKVIRQGAIAELLSGTAFELKVECSTPSVARDLLATPICPVTPSRRPTRRSRSDFPPIRSATSSPRSTANSSKAVFPSTGWKPTRPLSSRGSSK